MNDFQSGRISCHLTTMLKYLNPDVLVRRHIRQQVDDVTLGAVLDDDADVLQEIAILRMKEATAKFGHLVESQAIILDLADMAFTLKTTGLDVFKVC